MDQLKVQFCEHSRTLEKEGFAYVPQAAESLVSDSLRIPRVSRAGGLLFSAAKQKARLRGLLYFLAEKGGFEPPVGYEPTHAFQACDLNHSSISPEFVLRSAAF